MHVVIHTFFGWHVYAFMTSNGAFVLVLPSLQRHLKNREQNVMELINKTNISNM